MNPMLTRLLPLVFLLVAPDLWAFLDTPVPQTRFFEMADQDLSMNIMGFLFGQMSDLLPTTDTNIFSELFRIFNGSVMTLGVIVMAYTLIIGTINTAQEGEVMGRKWSSAWIPLRSIAGTALLAPTPAGYSTIQILTMWVVVNGVAAADLMWNTVLDYYSKNGFVVGAQSMAANSGPPVYHVRNARQFADSIINNALCEAQFNLYGDHQFDVEWVLGLVPVFTYSGWAHDSTATLIISDPGSPQYSDSSCDSQSCTLTINYGYTNNSPGYSATPDAQKWIQYPTACGQFTFTTPINAQNGIDETTARQIQKAKVSAFLKARADVLTAAQAAIVSSQGGTPPPQAALNTLASFPNVMGKAITSYQNELSSQLQGIKATSNIYNKQWIELVKNSGWMNAGAFYNQLANAPAGGSMLTAITTPPAYVEGGTQWTGLAVLYDNALFNGSLPWPGGNGFRRGYDAFSSTGSIEFNDIKNQFMELGYAPVSSILALQMNIPQPSQYASEFTKAMQASLGVVGQTIVETLINAVNGGNMDSDFLLNDPIMNIRTTGTLLIESLEVGILGAIVAIFVITLVLAAIPTLTLSTAILGLVAMLMPIVLAFVGLLWVYGATMAYYIPLIPYFLFLFGGVGWLVGVFESMVAAPLVALGLVVPSNEELGKAGHAIMMVTNLFLRPTLMIVGFIAGMFMVRIALYLLNVTFLAAFKANGGTITIFGSAAVITIYVGAMTVMINKAFDLIHEIPDKVLRWIGHNGSEQFGEARGLQQVQQSAESGAKRSQAIATDGGKAGNQLASRAGQAVGGAAGKAAAKGGDGAGT